MELTHDEKKRIVLDDNTYFLNNSKINKEHEPYIKIITEMLVNSHGDRKSKFIQEQHDRLVLYIQKEPELLSIIARARISEDLFVKLLGFILTLSNGSLHKILLLDKLSKAYQEYDVIHKHICANLYVVENIIDFLSNTYRNSTLSNTYKNSTLSNLTSFFKPNKINQNHESFNTSILIDTLVHYEIKGGINAPFSNNAIQRIKKILDDNKISYLEDVKVDGLSRKMDFAIPDATNPKILIEVLYQSVTAYTQEDKTKYEFGIRSQIKDKYPDCKSIGFIDGNGWIVRNNDLDTLVLDFENVFTFKENRLDKFRTYLTSEC